MGSKDVDERVNVKKHALKIDDKVKEINQWCDSDDNLTGLEIVITDAEGQNESIIEIGN